MDVSHIARELELDESEYLSLLKIFLSQTEKDVSEAQEATARSASKELHAAAHSIKGAAGSLGLSEIEGAASRICTTSTSVDRALIEAELAVITRGLAELAPLVERGSEGE